MADFAPIEQVAILGERIHHGNATGKMYKAMASDMESNSQLNAQDARADLILKMRDFTAEERSYVFTGKWQSSGSQVEVQ